MDTPTTHVPGGDPARDFDFLFVSQQWRLYWANQATGVFDQPMVGAFRDGRGEFHDQELVEGRAVFARFIWSDITPVSAHWEQALSDDGGRTWETNWTMDLERIS